MNNQEMYCLSEDEIATVNGGFACAGLCVLAAISAGAVLFSAGVTVGQAIK